MMEPTPEPTSGPSPDVRLVRLIGELTNMRDALVELSLLMQDYLYEQDSERRIQVDSQAEQAIQRAMLLAAQNHRKL